MPFDPLFGPPAPLPGWPEALGDSPFGSGLGPASPWSGQSPRILSAVERGITPFSAAHLGMFAWAPPIFSLSSALANLSPAWPQISSPAINLPDRPFYGRSSDWAQLGSSPPSALGQDQSGAAATISSAPPLTIGSPTSSFVRSGSISDAAPPVSFPGAPTSLRPASLALAGSPVPNVPGLGASSSPSGTPPDPSAAPASASVLFTHQPQALDLGARDRDPNNLDQSAEVLGVSDWPLSKSGTPFLPPPSPSASSPDQVLAAIHTVAPDLVDYFTKPLPPPPPFPSIPGKIPAVDSNPYAPGAILDAVNLAAFVATLGEPTPLAFAHMGEEAAPGATARTLRIAAPPPLDDAALQRLQGSFARRGEEALADSAAGQSQKEAGLDPAATAGADQILNGPYGTLRRQLPAGWQANHLNQDSVYWTVIPRKEGFSMGMRGNILTEPGTPHFNYHWSLEQFWDQYRRGGSLFGRVPTNADYGEALRQAVIAAGYSPEQASNVSAQAAAQRIAKGLIESEPVPRIPSAIWRRRRE